MFDINDLIKLEDLLYKINKSLNKNAVGIYISNSKSFYVLKEVRNKK
jgi:hypothetical protein